MILTLQRYVTRELLKTFALTAVGLTLVFALCGLFMNMLHADVLKAVQVAKILVLVLPIATTLTLPVSALFACAMVYGRLAADREFDACKASGINILRLLMPAVGLSICTASFTFASLNFLIPRISEQLNSIVKGDLQKVVYQTLKTKGYGEFGGYFLHADQTHLFDDRPELKTILIDRAVFIQYEHDELARCGTAESAQFDFSTDAARETVTLGATLKNVRLLDINREQLVEDEERPFAPVGLPTETKLNPKWLNLLQLLYYREHPTELPAGRTRLLKLQGLVREAQFYRYIREQLEGPKKMLELRDDRVRYEIRAGAVRLDSESLHPDLSRVHVVEFYRNGKRTYDADSCRIEVARGGGSGTTPYASLTLGGKVELVDSSDPKHKIERRKWDLDKVGLAGLFPVLPSLPDEKVLLGDYSSPESLRADLPSLGLGSRVDDAREADRGNVFSVRLRLTSLMHSQLAFSASSLVILILASALGIIFRGGQMLSAFVISFIPGLLVVVLNIMGRQLSKNPEMFLAGLGVIWAGIAIVAIADIIVLAKYLKR
jgi:lipopolysaccharide export LptBFGC system permease protein LptF